MAQLSKGFREIEGVKPPEEADLCAAENRNPKEATEEYRDKKYPPIQPADIFMTECVRRFRLRRAVSGRTQKHRAEIGNTQ